MRPEDTIKDLLVKINVDPVWGKYALQQLNSRRRSIATKNDKVEADIGQSFDPRSVDATNLHGKLNEFRVENPKAYNDFIDGLVAFSKAETDRKAKDIPLSFTAYDVGKNGKLSPNTKADQEYIKTIDSKIGDSSANVDQAIADYHQERSLTTSAVSAAYKSMQILADSIPTMTKEDAATALKTMNGYIDFLDAAALKTFDAE